VRRAAALAGVALVAAAVLTTSSASTTSLAAACGFAGTGTAVATVRGDLYYTRYGVAGDNLRRLPFEYDGEDFYLASPHPIGKGVPRADGLLFVPDGDILVGGAADAVYKVDPKSGAYSTKKAGGIIADHLALDPSGNFVYAAAIPGPIGTIPLKPFADGTRHDITGDDTAVTGIAFDACGQAYYTTGGSGGRGFFGRLDTAKFTTKRLIKAVVPAAHGLAYDQFTGDIMLFGNTHITQYDTKTQRIVSDLEVPGVTLDQGATDGQGHLFVADNGGNLVFVDYSKTKLVGAKSNKVEKRFVEANLDDIAPLSGLGAAAPPPPVPTRTVNVEEVAGTVMIRQRGTNKFVPLNGTAQIPTGSEIDATKGQVELTSANADGTTQSARFYQGRFVITQPKAAGLFTELTLSGPLTPCATCKVPKGAGAKVPPKERHLWGNGKGKFRTKGKFASATVRGTKWLTQDFSDRTLVKVEAGTVDVFDKKKKKHIIVKRHHSYVARG
jgi:hypothetical protein